MHHGLRQPQQILQGPAAGRPGTEVRGWPAAAGPQVPPGLPFTAELNDSSPLQLPQSELPSCLLPCVADGLASADASPAKDALQPDSPPALLTQLCSPAGSPSQLLQFGRLRIDSATSSPQLSPRPPSQRASPEAKQCGVSSPAGTPPASQLVTSLWRWQQQQQQQQQVAASPVPLLAPEDSDDKDWCIPASPGICSQQGAQPVPALIPLSPGLHAPQSQQHSVRAAGGEAAAAPPAGVPASPFHSSQERREEIAILSEMAEAGAAEWSSQEAEVPPPPAQQLQQQQHPRPSGACSLVAAVVSQPGGSQQGGVHLACSLTSQEASEVADPWSQPEDEAEEQRRQQQQAEEERQHWALEAAAQAEQQQEQAQVQAVGQVLEL